MTIQNAVSQIQSGLDYFRQIGHVSLGSNNQISIHVTNKPKFNSFDGDVTFRKRSSCEYPYEAVKMIDGIEFFTLIPIEAVSHDKCECCGQYKDDCESNLHEWLVKQK